MPKFHYTALNAQGEETQGLMEAPSSDDVVTALRDSGFFPTNVVEAGHKSSSLAVDEETHTSARPLNQARGTPGSSLLLRRGIKGKTLMVFTRQLATLIDAGLPLLKALDVLARQERDRVLKRTILSLADSVRGGGTFSEGLAQHPRIFSKLYVNMVRAGELGGVLEQVLLRLAEFHEKAEKIKSRVKTAMIYPVIVMTVALIILTFLLTFIVPKFQAIFKDMLGDKPLPALTRFVIGVSDAFKNNFLLIALGLAGLGVLYWLFARTEKGTEIIDRIKLKLPMFGDLIVKGAISRFSRTLGTLIASGVPILKALLITRETAGNAIIADAVTDVHDSVKEGESIVTPLEASQVFPPMVISMVDVGEETGQLSEMLLKVADVYDEEVDNAVAGLTSLLEPAMILFLAVVVGTIVLALFLPLISIIQGGLASPTG